MQPTYLPWPGYFGLINSVDTFVFLDDVQFVKQSWHSRNRILTKNGVRYLTIPTTPNGVHSKLLSQMEIVGKEGAISKHLETIRHSYSNSIYFIPIFHLLTDLSNAKIHNLANFNIHMITNIARLLGIDTKFVKSSDFPTSKNRSEKLAHILDSIGSNSYYSPIGAREYIEQDGTLQRDGVSISYQNFVCQQYPQILKGFVPNLSIIDMMFNVDLAECLNIIQSSNKFIS